MTGRHYRIIRGAVDRVGILHLRSQVCRMNHVLAIVRPQQFHVVTAPEFVCVVSGVHNSNFFSLDHLVYME